jgi:hypothetical protein
MATSQGSQRGLHVKPSFDATDASDIPGSKIGRKRGRITRPRSHWVEGPPRSMKPFQN